LDYQENADYPFEEIHRQDDYQQSEDYGYDAQNWLRNRHTDFLEPFLNRFSQCSFSPPVAPCMNHVLNRPEFKTF